MAGARVLQFSVILDIAERFIRWETTLVAEAKKHGVTPEYLYQWSRREKWEQKRNEYRARRLANAMTPNGNVAAPAAPGNHTTTIINQAAPMALPATVDLGEVETACAEWHTLDVKDLKRLKVKALTASMRGKSAEKSNRWFDLWVKADERERLKLLRPLPGTINYGQAGAAGNRGRGRRVMGSGDLSVDLPAEQPATSEQPAEAPVRPVSEQGQSAGPGPQAGVEAVGPAGAVDPKGVGDQRPLEAAGPRASGPASESDPGSQAETEDWPAED